MKTSNNLISVVGLGARRKKDKQERALQKALVPSGLIKKIQNILNIF